MRLWQLLPAEWKITPAPVYSQIFCTQPAICYVVKTDFFSLLQRKINCKEGREFVFILAWWSRVPGWWRTAVGEGWPTRCLLPLPCLAAQSLWQNKPPGILGKHWEPLNGIRTISWERHSQESFTLPILIFFSNWIAASVSHLLSKIRNSHDQKMPVQSVACKYEHHSAVGEGAEIANKHVLFTRSNNSQQEIRSSTV